MAATQLPYIDSNNINIYPCAYRGEDTNTGLVYNSESRMNSEKNITSFSNSLNSFGYVLDFDSSSKNIVFYIHGYRVETNLSSILPTSYSATYGEKGIVYACIKLNTKTVEAGIGKAYTTEVLANYNNQSQDKLDINDKFQGIQFQIIPEGDNPPAISDSHIVLDILSYSVQNNNYIYTAAHNNLILEPHNIHTNHPYENSNNESIEDGFYTVNLEAINISADSISAYDEISTHGTLTVGSSITANSITVKDSVTIENGLNVQDTANIGNLNVKNSANIETLNVGITNTLKANYSLTIGVSNQIGTSSQTIYNAFAQGNYTKATADNAHAEGNYTEANGRQSHAEGDHTVANSDNQHVFGRYNAIDNNNEYVEIVGNGFAGSTNPHHPASRKNARTLDWSGNEYIAGNEHVAGQLIADGGLSVEGGLDVEEGDVSVGNGDIYVTEGNIYLAKGDIYGTNINSIDVNTDKITISPKSKVEVRFYSNSTASTHIDKTATLPNGLYYMLLRCNSGYNTIIMHLGIINITSEAGQTMYAHYRSVAGETSTVYKGGMTIWIGSPTSNNTRTIILYDTVAGIVNDYTLIAYPLGSLVLPA